MTKQFKRTFNRTAPGKEDTFVLDFVNEPGEIFDTFKPYYERTPVGEDVDPHKLYEIQARLDAHHVYHADEVEAFCRIYFDPGTRDTPGDHRKLNACLDPAVARFEALDEGNEEIFTRLMNDDAFRGVAAAHLLRQVYHQIRASGER